MCFPLSCHLVAEMEDVNSTKFSDCWDMSTGLVTIIPPSWLAKHLGLCWLNRVLSLYVRLNRKPKYISHTTLAFLQCLSGATGFPKTWGLSDFQDSSSAGGRQQDKYLPKFHLRHSHSFLSFPLVLVSLWPGSPPSTYSLPVMPEPWLANINLKKNPTKISSTWTHQSYLLPQGSTYNLVVI